MSTDGSLSSNGSRIRQFGLYRTIDARTEEFLRLSRKRQLRQGCACAAVSTAITVTVVVSVILVYEYSINSEANPGSKLTLRSNWLGLMNESSDDNLFDAKFTKNKLNLSRATLKLLPILIKALNQNRYIDKIIEEYASSTPSYDKKETTEKSFKRDFAPDARNWFRMHTPKLYAVEYKTSPVVYYKSPKKSSEYFTKIRKIRDYQRIFNYVDKMISEKVGYSSTIPMIVGKFSRSEKPPLKQYTAPIKAYKFQTTAHKSRSSVSSKKRTAKENKDDTKCNCPKKLRDLLNKLIVSIQKVLPYTSTELPCTSCNDEQSTKLPPKHNFVKMLKPKNRESKISTTTPKLALTTDIKSAYSEIGYNDNVAIIQKKSLYRKLMNMISSESRPKFDRFDSKKIIFNFYRKPVTSTNSYIEATTVDDSVQTTTKPMLHIEYDKNNIFLDQVQTDITGCSTKRNPTEPILSESEYDDYFATTPYNMNDKLDMQLIKTKMQSLNQNENKIYQDRGTASTMKYSHILNKTNVTPKNRIDLQRNPSKSHLTNVESKSRFDDLKNLFFGNLGTVSSPSIPLIGKDNHSSLNLKPEETIFKSLLENKVKPGNSTSKPRLEIINLNHPNLILSEQKKISQNNKDPIQGIDNTLLEEDVDRGNDEFQDEYKQFYSTLEKPAKSNVSASIKYKPEKYDTEKPSKKKISDIEIKDIFNVATESFKASMIPSSRPIYLEINRNDWVRDENQDFDINMNHDLFDLPNS